MKNPIIVPVTQIVELGKATSLTMGYGAVSWEPGVRPKN